MARMVLNILNKHDKIWIQLAVMVRDCSLTNLGSHSKSGQVSHVLAY